MGTNCAPFLANIFLHVYEYEYLNKLMNEGNVVTAKLISNTFRYQDDCISLNDNDTFRHHYKNIYPIEMTLERIPTFLRWSAHSLIYESRYSEVNLDIAHMTNAKTLILIFVTSQI